MIQVLIVDIFEYSVLIQYEDASKHLQRCYVHRELLPVSLKGRPVSLHEEYLALGIPASDVDLVATLGEELPTIHVRELQDQLRRAGLWTRADYQKKSQVVHGVLQRILGIDTTRILNAAATTPVPKEE